MSDELQNFLQSRASGDLLPWSAQAAAALEFQVSFAQIEETALQLGLLPIRYQRNRQTISVENQLRLFRSRVAIIGMGGLGGHILEGLARLGVGTLVAVDPDVFQEHNLNRQILSTMHTLECPKVEIAGKRVAEINPAITVVPIQGSYTPENGRSLLQGAHVVVDALDSIATRLALAATCAELGIPMVHGAIAGWYGQVTTQFPGQQNLEWLYGHATKSSGVEQQLGNPSFTPALVASIETAEVCKILLGMGTALCSRNLFINLLDMSFDVISFAGHSQNNGRKE